MLGKMKILWTNLGNGSATYGVWGEMFRLAAATLRKFLADKGTLRASTLAFSTAFGLVPLLAFTLAAIKLLGLEQNLIRILSRQLVAGDLHVSARIMGYVQQVDFSALGVAGLMSLSFSVLLVLDSLDESFNKIFGKVRRRSLGRKMVDYIIVLIVCPFLLVLSASMVTSTKIRFLASEIALIENFLPLLFFVGPIVFKSIAFVSIFLLLPSRRPRFSSAIAGGLFSALAWHLAEWCYVSFGVVMFKNNAIYGALAQLPAFLLWVYTGWCILIAGAELTSILTLPDRGRNLGLIGTPKSLRPLLALELLSAVSVGQQKGGKGDEGSLFISAGVSLDEGRYAIEKLLDAGLLVPTEGIASYRVSLQNPDIPMSEVIALIKAACQDALGRSAVESRFLESFTSSFGTTSWADWITLIGDSH